jgi:hypothetical protein
VTDDELRAAVMVQISIASSAMALGIASLSLYAGYAFRRGKVLNGRLVFLFAAAIGFFGVLGALWGPLDLWIALIPAFLVGPMSGVISYRLTRHDVLATTAYLGRRSPTN